MGRGDWISAHAYDRALEQVTELDSIARQLCGEGERMSKLRRTTAELQQYARSEQRERLDAIDRVILKLTDEDFAKKEAVEAFQNNQNYKEFVNSNRVRALNSPVDVDLRSVMNPLRCWLCQQRPPGPADCLGYAGSLLSKTLWTKVLFHTFLRLCAVLVFLLDALSF